VTCAKRSRCIKGRGCSVTCTKRCGGIKGRSRSVTCTIARAECCCVGSRSVKRGDCTKNGTCVSASLVDSRPCSGQRAVIFFDDNVVNTENRCRITLNKYLGGFFYSRTIKDFNSQLTNHIPNMACRKPRAARWRCRHN
jgi:hypothetical protein